MLKIQNNKIYISDKFEGYLYLYNRNIWILEMENIPLKEDEYLIENKSRDYLIDYLISELILREMF